MPTIVSSWRSSIKMLKTNARDGSVATVSPVSLAGDTQPRVPQRTRSSLRDRFLRCPFNQSRCYCQWLEVSEALMATTSDGSMLPSLIWFERRATGFSWFLFYLRNAPLETQVFSSGFSNGLVNYRHSTASSFEAVGRKSPSLCAAKRSRNATETGSPSGWHYCLGVPLTGASASLSLLWNLTKHSQTSFVTLDCRS